MQVTTPLSRRLFTQAAAAAAAASVSPLVFAADTVKIGYLLGLGLLAIVVTIFFKLGLRGIAPQRWGWTLFPTQRVLSLHKST